jgi:hypothetical protein
MFTKLLEREHGLKQRGRLRQTLEFCLDLVERCTLGAIESDLARMVAELTSAKASIIFLWERETERISVEVADGLAEPDARSEALITSGRAGELVIAHPTTKDTAVPEWVSHTVVIPLKTSGTVSYLLWLWFDAGSPEMTGEEKQALILFCDIGGALLGSKDRVVIPHNDLWMIVALIGTFLLETKIEAKALAAILTAVTSGWGLRFNRAAIFLLNETGDRLLGTSGIGELKKGQAEDAWRAWRTSSHSTVEGYCPG